MHQFLNFIFEWNSTCFGQFLCPSSVVFHCTHSNGTRHTVLRTACEQEQDGNAVPSCSCSQQTTMIYTIAVRTVEYSWWWTEELSETCRVSFDNKFGKLVLLFGFILWKFVTTHGHMNVKFWVLIFGYETKEVTVNLNQMFIAVAKGIHSTGRLSDISLS